MFDKGLENQKNNFDNMIQPKKPKDIDFSDKNEDKPIMNLGRVMDQTLADREKELQMITRKYSKQDRAEAVKWIQPEGGSMNDTPKIKIENDSLPIPLKPILKTSQKRVKFSIEEKSQLNEIVETNKIKEKQQINGFLSKLKKKPLGEINENTKQLETQNNNIINKLDTIILKMNEIIELLKVNQNEKVKRNEIEKKVENLVLEAI